MFRNALEALVIDRQRMREWEVTSDQAIAEVIQKSELLEIVDSQPISNIPAHADPGSTSITYSLPEMADSKGPVHRKGGYKTSIFVNGPSQSPIILDSSSGSSCSLNLSDYENRKPEDSPYYIHASLPDSYSANHSGRGCNRSLPVATITVGDIYNSTPNSKTPRNSPSAHSRRHHSSNSHQNGGNCSIQRKLEPQDLHESDVSELVGVVPECYSQKEFNVVSPVQPRIDSVFKGCRDVPDYYSQTEYNVVSPVQPRIDPVFKGCRDVRDPGSICEEQITSVKGSVRGFKNRVRAGIVTFWEEEPEKRNYRHLEQGKIIVYGTSMSIVRETSERCRSVRRLLQNHMVRYEERDLFMCREIQAELRHRLSQEGVLQVHLPHVFADGVYIGGAGELEKLNEAGKLRGILENYQKVSVRIMCEKCGGFRFLPCDSCHGSKKSLLRNNFTEDFCALRCVQCDGNGMRRCDVCVDQQE